MATRAHSFPRQIDGERAEFRVFGNEFHPVALTMDAFDRDLIAQACHHDLPGPELMSAMHGKEISLQNARILHAGSSHLEQIIGARLEEQGIDLIVRFDMLGGEYGAACSDPPDDRNACR